MDDLSIATLWAPFARLLSIGMTPMIIILLGLIVTGGIYWQCIIFRKDRSGDGLRRLYASGAISILVILGTSAYGILAVLDKNQDLSWLGAAKLTGRSILAMVILNAKTYLCALVACALLASAVYSLALYDQFIKPGLLAEILSLVFGYRSRTLELAYYAFTFVFCVGVSFWGSKGVVLS